MERVNKNSFNKFGEIEIESPVDNIIKQLRRLIYKDLLKPGEKLPSERDLADKFNVSRVVVRESLKLLEFNGLIKKLPPRKGLFVADNVFDSISNFIENIVLNKDNFNDFLEIYYMSHIESLSYFNKHPNELVILKNINNELKNRILKIKQFIEYDCKFHLNIIKNCNNKVLKSISIPINDRIFILLDEKYYDIKKMEKILYQHNEIIEDLKENNFENYRKNLKNHFSSIKLVELI